MVIVEKSFPRGGVAAKDTNSGDAKDNIIFGALQKKVRRPTKKPKDDLADLLNEDREDNIETASAALLNYDTIQDGMNIMGMVKAVDQLYLSISLPGRMTARVSALEISESYTKATKEFLQNAAEQTESFKPLKDLYHVGQIVYGRVLELNKHENGRTDINMSLKPSEVHAELQHSAVRKGFILNGAIEEVQEHGYIIESGIKGMRAFLPIGKSEPGHAVGALIPLKVEKITQDQAASTCICKEIKPDQTKIKNQNDPNLDYILPATIVQFNVTKQLKNGLQGTLMNESFTAYINEHQLADPLALPEDYDVGAQLQARVLYVMPLTKFVYLTLNLRQESEEKKQENDAFKRGDIIDAAKVHHLGTGGVILVLKNKFKGVISYRTIKTNYKGNYDQDELLARYARKTSHKVRVLDYDLMDSMYLCTDDATIVEEKVFALDDLQPGDFVSAVVKERLAIVGGYMLQVGKVKGIIEQLYLAPTTKTLEEKSKIRCRVIAINTERRTVYLTNRVEYLAKNSKVLTSLTEAREKAIYMGTIVKCEDAYLLVKFFNHLKGVLHKQQLSGFLGAETNFYEGQTMPFRIVSKNEEQITLGLPETIFPLGEICPATVTNTLEAGLEIRIALDQPVDNTEEPEEVKGLIPIRLLSDFEDLLQAKLRAFPALTQTQAVCMVKNIFSLRDVDYFQENLVKEWGKVQPGDILKACVKNVAGEVVELALPIRGYAKLVKLHLKMLLVNVYRNPNVVLSPEQVVYVKVLGKQAETRMISVSARLTDIWDGQLSSSAEYMARYLKEVGDIKKAFKKHGNPIAQYSIGEKVSALFQGVSSDTGNWQYELEKTKLQVVLKASLVGKSKTPKVGDKQDCVILWIDYSNEWIFVSNKPGDSTHITKSSQIPPNLVGKSGINAKIMLKQDNLFICSLKKGPNPLVYCPTRLHFNDFENSGSINIKEGDFCRLTFIHDSKPIAVPENTWKLWQELKRKRKALEEAATLKSKKQKISNQEKQQKQKELSDSEDDEDDDEEEEETKPKMTKILKRKIEELNKNQKKTKKNTKQENSKKLKCNAKVGGALFFEDKTPDEVEVVKMTEISKKQNATSVKIPETKAEVKTLPGISDFWSTDLTLLNKSTAEASSDEEDDDQDSAAQKKKKLSTAEKFKQQRDEESRLRAIEEKYADPNQLPESVDQFDRLVLSDPNNSKHWVNYMVFHLQSTEIDKARAVARRAIKVISFRDGTEQINIWVALLNLELRYGSKESFDETLREALTYNDPLKIYLLTLEILCDAGGRQQEALEMIGVITRKFKQEQEVWKAAANAYFAVGMAERAQQMLHKALACLPEREHVNTIVIFANLNQKHGNNEMAQTLLDQVVTSYPKRVDVWAQYVDMLIKENLVDSARAVLERAVIQKIPLKKMRTIFKKYLEFEERFGTETDVQKVKQLATEYVKNNTNL